MIATIVAIMVLSKLPEQVERKCFQIIEFKGRNFIDAFFMLVFMIFLIAVLCG